VSVTEGGGCEESASGKSLCRWRDCELLVGTLNCHPAMAEMGTSRAGRRPEPSLTLPSRSALLRRLGWHSQIRGYITYVWQLERALSTPTTEKVKAWLRLTVSIMRL
jgi:hypothetical protein